MSGFDDKGQRFTKDNHFYTSDDKEYDILFVQHCLFQHWTWLTNQGVRLQHHIVWSDGCVVQFKDSLAMYFVVHYPSLTSGWKMSWHYFGTRHGKGEWNGVDDIVKRTLRVEQLHNPQRRLQHAFDVVQFLKEGLSFQTPITYERKESSITRHF